MSVYNYNGKNHPYRYVGFRVSVMVDNKQKQKYFNCRGLTKKEKESVLEAARKLESQWLVLKEKAQKKRDNKALHTRLAVNTTGVRGITTTTEHYKKNGRFTGGSRNVYQVQIQHNGVQYFKRFPLTDKGWALAVKFLAKAKQLTRYKHLIARKGMKFNDL